MDLLELIAAKEDAEIITAEEHPSDNETGNALPYTPKPQSCDELRNLIESIRTAVVDQTAFFWKHVDKTPGQGPDGDCWGWRSAIERDDYGKYIIGNGKNRKTFMAHRLAYMLVVGEIPDGMELNHKCEYKPCVRPEHLNTVTHHENLLYSDTIVTRNLAKTHCPAGHEYTPENTFRQVVKNGSGRGRKKCRVIATNISKKARMARDPEYRERILREDRERIQARRERKRNRAA